MNADINYAPLAVVPIVSLILLIFFSIFNSTCILYTNICMHCRYGVYYIEFTHYRYVQMIVFNGVSTKKVKDK